MSGLAGQRDCLRTGKNLWWLNVEMMYLAETLIDCQGVRHSMVGALSITVSMQARLAALGMQRLDTPLGEFRGHTSHYSQLDCAPVQIACAQTSQGQPGPAVLTDGVRKLHRIIVRWAEQQR